MLAVITKGADAAGLVRYVMKAEDRAGRSRPAVAVLAATIPGRSAAEYVQAFRAVARLRTRLRRNVSHIVLSFRPDAPQPSDALAATAAEALAQGLGHDTYLAVRHGGHVHIVALRVRRDGSAVSDSQDFARAERIVRTLEREHGLAPDRPSRHTDPARPAPARQYGRREAGRFHRTGEVPARITIAQAIDGALGEGRATVTTLAERLRARGVEMTVHAARNGRVAGASFTLGDVTMKGSEVGKSYGWTGLRKRGLEHDEHHDGRDEAPSQGGLGVSKSVGTGPRIGVQLGPLRKLGTARLN